jgi:5'-deoxynucleotidase YfbR-like HD superfamily hydrolase
VDNLYNHLDQKADIYQQVLFLMNGGAVRRFHTMATIKEITISAHSFRVAWFCYLLDPNAKVQLIMASLAHDMAEQVWGDIPSPAKRLNGVNETLEKHEESLLVDNHAYFPLTESEERILKLADCAAGMLECVQERALGNRFVEAAFEKFVGYYEKVPAIPINDAVRWKLCNAIIKLWEQANGER